MDGSIKPIDVEEMRQQTELEQMPIEELINATSSKLYSAALIADIFKQNYENKLFRIEYLEESSNKIVESSNDEIIVTDIEMTENLLTNFGHLIKKVHVNYENLNYPKAKTIDEHISKFCSNSLIEFHATNFTTNPLARVPYTFLAVEIASFAGKATKIDGDSGHLGEIFPAVQKLFLNVDDIHEQEFLDFEFPQLKHVEVLFGIIGYTIGFEDGNVEKLLVENSQIQSMSMKFPTFSFLHKMSYLLPNIEALSIVMLDVSWTRDFSGKIEFGRVKKFTLFSTEFVPSNLVFDQLEEITFGTVHPISNR